MFEREYNPLLSWLSLKELNQSLLLFELCTLALFYWKIKSSPQYLVTNYFDTNILFLVGIINLIFFDEFPQLMTSNLAFLFYSDSSSCWFDYQMKNYAWFYYDLELSAIKIFSYEFCFNMFNKYYSKKKKIQTVLTYIYFYSRTS